MARLLPFLIMVTITLLAYVKQAQSGEYGKVTCSGTSPVPDLILTGSFLKAKCPLPATYGDEEMGKLSRCVFKFLKLWTSPNKIDQTKYFTVMNGIYPKAYQASMKTKHTACLKAHSKTCKDETADPTGKGWAPMIRCMQKWYEENLCKKE